MWINENSEIETVMFDFGVSDFRFVGIVRDAGLFFGIVSGKHCYILLIPHFSGRSSRQRFALMNLVNEILYVLPYYFTVCLISRTAPINPAGYSGESLLK
jgi:hypothetical protein